MQSLVKAIICTQNSQKPLKRNMHSQTSLKKTQYHMYHFIEDIVNVGKILSEDIIGEH